MGVGGQRHVPAALPPGMTRYPLYRRLGRPQGRSGRVLKISPPPGFDPRTAQPVASRYTDYANPALISLLFPWKFSFPIVGLKISPVPNFAVKCPANFLIPTLLFHGHSPLYRQFIIDWGHAHPENVTPETS